MSYQFLSEFLNVTEIIHIYEKCLLLLEARISYGPRQRVIIKKAEELIRKNASKARVYLAKIKKVRPSRSRQAFRPGDEVFGDPHIQLITSRLKEFARRGDRIRAIVKKIQDEARRGIKY